MKSCSVYYAGYLAVALIAACAKDYMPLFLEGTWMVVDHKAPGISAMDPDQADLQLGKIASYGHATASFDQESCSTPVYRLHMLNHESFFTEYKIPPESLGFAEDPIEIVSVFCQGKAWLAPGSILMKLDNEHLIFAWDGVFFVLQKR